MRLLPPFEDAITLAEMATRNEDGYVDEVKSELNEIVNTIERKGLKFCFPRVRQKQRTVSFHPGAGGTEAQMGILPYDYPLG